MNGTMHKWLLKSLGSLSLASTVVLLPLLLTGCGESSTGTVTPVPPPPPPPPPAPPAPPAPPPPPPTPTPAPTPTTDGSISALPTQVAAIAQTGEVFSNPTVIPVGYGIRRSGAVPVGTRSDFRAVLSFPIPDAIPSNAIVQRARLTLVQLSPNDSANIPGFGNRGLGFFFLDPTPHNLPANRVVFQEVQLDAVNNVLSSDFSAPATSDLVTLSFTGNVLGGDVSAGPRTADVVPGVQRAVSASGPRFYQVRLQCAREVLNNQATSAFVSVLATASASVSVSATASASGTLGSLILAGTLELQPAANVANNQTTVQVQATGLATATLVVAGATTLVVFDPFTTAVSVSNALASGGTVAASVSLTFGSFTQIAQLPSSQLSLTTSAGFFLGITTGTFSVTRVSGAALGTTDVFSIPISSQVAPPGFVALTTSVSASAPVTASVSFNVASPVNYEVSQGATGTCRAEFDREPATGTGARGPRLDITFTIPR